jgi:hypothetical protein
MNKLQLNKFSYLHDEEKIFFTKTDFLLSDFEKIKKLNNDVILISGNSDYSINDDYLNSLPNNVKVWFAVNAEVNHPKIIPIPIGLCNYKQNKRCVSHGWAFPEDTEKIFDDIDLSIKPNKLIYSNFSVHTNFDHRIPCRDISKKIPHIDWEDPTLEKSDFLNKILQYESVFCPSGNGIDTYRLWEVLYTNRIPITIKMGNYKIYELYEKLPILVLNDILELENEEKIRNKIIQIKNQKYNLNLLDFDYWKSKILNFL